MEEIKTVIISLIITVMANKYFLKKQLEWMDKFFEEEKLFINDFIYKFLKDSDRRQ